MKISKAYFVLTLLCWSLVTYSQQYWSHKLLPPMPMPISNNSVTAATINEVPHVFSFGGIDTSKIYAGISNKSFKFNTETGVWDTIPDLPLDRTVIAAGANTINNKIYFIGGYSVFSSGNELSSSKLLIYDPETEEYTKENIPKAIDDHIQAVWRDSLIYVVTGWSNSNNVVNTQIYDTYTNEWLTGTPVPNETSYKVFGGSGAIVEDTIYYAGGAAYFTTDNVEPFRLVPFLRKGVINPENPAEIEWSIVEDSLALGYRMACFAIDHKIHWLGGGQTAYNYDGIAYNGTGGVAATDRILTLDTQTGELTESFGDIPLVMDLRGVAEITKNKFIIAGGMVENQQVTDQVFSIEWVDESIDTMMVDTSTAILETLPLEVEVELNQNQINIKPNDFEQKLKIQLFDYTGKLVLETEASGAQNIPIAHLPKGNYLIQVIGANQKRLVKKMTLNF